MARAVDLLQRHYQHDDLLRGVVTGKVPRMGELGAVSHRFHGVGCEVDFGSHSVDFDFGPGGRIDGFDAWRLSLYAEQFPNRFPDCDEGTIGRALKRMIDDGSVVRPQMDPSPHLCYRVKG